MGNKDHNPMFLQRSDTFSKGVTSDEIIIHIRFIPRNKRQTGRAIQTCTS